MINLVRKGGKLMRNVFLSRPTSIAEKYKPGLDGFIQYLKGKEIAPRTLGTTDYPTNAPMDEVIALLRKCEGAIILGYPQIVVQTGLIKGNKIEETITLGTEWNHIEAALAYSLHMPLLVIYDSSVSRGIFDCGTLNSFLYSTNFENPAWFVETDIAGAVNTWVERLPKRLFI